MSLFALPSFSSPLVYPNEVVVDFKVPRDCLLNPSSLSDCSGREISASLISGNLGDIQVSAAFRLSGNNQGALGAKVFQK